MAEYATKEQVKEEILNWARCINNPERLITEDALYVIDMLPSADVRPVVRGEWIDDGCITRCKYCGEEKEFPHWRFCPNCGADMRETEE